MLLLTFVYVDLIFLWFVSSGKARRKGLLTYTVTPESLLLCYNGKVKFSVHTGNYHNFIHVGVGVWFCRFSQHRHQLAWRAMSLDFSTVYPISLTQNHSGSQSFLFMIHFHHFCVCNIYILLFFKFTCSHPKDV